MSVTLQHKESDYLRIYKSYDIAPTEKLVKWMKMVNKEEEYILVDFIPRLSEDFWVVHKVNPPF